MPGETAQAICCMIFGGVLERHPNLKVCFAHGGKKSQWKFHSIIFPKLGPGGRSQWFPNEYRMINYFKKWKKHLPGLVYFFYPR